MPGCRRSGDQGPAAGAAVGAECDAGVAGCDAGGSGDQLSREWRNGMIPPFRTKHQ